MPKKTARPIADPQVQIILEHMNDQFRLLKEGEDAVKNQLRSEQAAGFERVDDQLLFIRLRLDAVEQSQAGMKADLSDLKGGQARIEARLDRVVDTVTRHDAEIIKLWAVHRTPSRGKRRTARD